MLAKGKNFYASKRRELADTLEQLLYGESLHADRVCIMSFGKYKGKAHDYVYNLDPTYLAWAWKKGLVDMSKWVDLSVKSKHEQDLQCIIDECTDPNG